MKDIPIGFIQGRLSPLVDHKIQAFPMNHWRKEFPIARKYGFRIMEWTLDQDQLYENPFMTGKGRSEIINLISKHNVSIPSLTGDCFMQNPFFKKTGSARESLLKDLQNIITACSFVGVKLIVFPLVDEGSLENEEQEESLLEGLSRVENDLCKHSIKIIFESDYCPDKFKKFISKFSENNFGINYDTGNSASMGFDFKEEIKSYGQRILNVHIKDRLLHGTTVPLGHGDAEIPKVIRELKSIGYSGNYILQTARSVDGNHAEVLKKYHDELIEWIK